MIKKKNLRTLTAILLSMAFILGLGPVAVEAEYNKAEAVKDAANTVIAKINNDKEISLLEMNFYAGMVFQQLAQSPAFHPQAQTMMGMPMPTDDGEKTMRQLIIDMLKDELVLKEAVLREAKDRELSEDDKKVVDSFFMSLAQNAQQNGLELNELIAQFFGPGATVENIRPLIENDIRQSSYLTELYEEIKISPEAIEEEYAANPQLYDLVSYVMVQVPAELAEEDLAELEAITEKSTDAENFVQEVFEVLGDEKMSLENFKLQSHKVSSFNDFEDTALQDWIFDAERQAGDATILETEKGKVAISFVERHRDEQQNYDSRHILVREMGENEIDQNIAKATATAIFEGIKAHDIDEDFFANMASKYSDDQGSSQNGGLYEDVAPGNFVKPYEEFCLAEGREAGDLEMVYVDGPSYYGYHIIYFLGLRAPNWERAAEQKLHNEAVQSKITALTQDYSFDFVENGEELIFYLPAPEISPEEAESEATESETTEALPDEETELTAEEVTELESGDTEAEATEAEDADQAEDTTESKEEASEAE